MTRSRWTCQKHESNVGPFRSRYRLASLQAFQALCKLKKAALTIIAQQMNETQIELLTQTFLGASAISKVALAC